MGWEPDCLGSPVFRFYEERLGKTKTELTVGKKENITEYNWRNSCNMVICNDKEETMTGGEWVYDSEGDNVYYDYCSSGKRLNAYYALRGVTQ